MARGSIFVRENKDGGKRYATIIRVDGKQRWKTFDRKKDAEGYLDRNSTDVREGTYRELKPASFSQYAAHWRNTHLIPESFKPSTYNSYCGILDRHLIPELGAYQMAAITAAEINALTAKILKGDLPAGRGPLSRKTAVNILNLLGSILDKAVTEGFLKFSPMASVEKPRTTKEKKGRALKPDEIQAIVKQCTGQLRLLFLTALLTGMRLGELLGLWWEDIGWDENLIRIRRSLYWRDGKYHKKAEGDLPWVFVAPKSKASAREIDLSPALRKELLELYMKSQKAGLVFHTEGKTPLRPQNVTQRAFVRALEKAEEKRVEEKLPAIGAMRWHDLRHTFGSMKLEQGENIYYVQRQMGHSSIQVTVDIYGHQLESRKPEAAAKTDAMIFGKNS